MGRIEEMNFSLRTRRAAAAAKSAEKRRAQRAGSQDQDQHDRDAVIAGLQRAAEKGSAPAARELRAWLADQPEARIDEGKALLARQPEDLTPAERELARAYLQRRTVRAVMRIEGLRAAAERREQGLSEEHEEGTARRTPPPQNDGTPARSHTVGPTQAHTDTQTTIEGLS